MDKKISKNKVDELRLKLLRTEEELVKKISELKKDDPFLDPEHANDNAAVDTDVREQLDHETIEAQVVSLQKKLDRVAYALKKILKDKYGECESCGKQIKIERLDLVPEAKYCIDCEKRLVK